MVATKVAFIGAGIMATSAAYQLLEARPDLDVTIISKSFSPNTTSDGAAGYWGPYFAMGTPEEVIWYVSVCHKAMYFAFPENPFYWRCSISEEVDLFQIVISKIIVTINLVWLMHLSSSN